MIREDRMRAQTCLTAVKDVALGLCCKAARQLGF